MVSKALIAGIVLLLLGLGLIIAGPVIYAVIHGVRDSSIDTQVRLEKPSSEIWPSIATNQFEGLSPITYRTFYIFNITNLAQAKSGAAPIFNEVGPFVYRLYNTLVDTSFINYQNFTYKKYQQQIFVPEMSVFPDTTSVNIVNGAYLSILRTAGSEQNLGISVFASFLSQLNSTLYNNFVQGQLIPAAVSTTLPGYFLQQPNSADVRADWINGTSYAPLGVSSSLPVSLAAYINDSLAVQLFTPTVTYSLASPTYNLLWIKALTDASTSTFLQNYWGLPAPAVQVLGAWLYNTWIKVYNPALVVRNYAAAGATSSYDIALLQWSSLAGTSTKAGTPGPSLNTLNATAAPFPVEYAAWDAQVFNNSAPALTLANARTIFSQFTTPLGWGTFLATLSRQPTAVQTVYGLTLQQAQGLVAYSRYVVGQIINPTFSQGSGLYTTQTVRNSIFGLQDPLLQRLSPGATFAAQVNYTSEDEALDEAGKEGKSVNLDSYLWYTEYNGYTALPYWATPETFKGGDGLNRAPHRFNKKDDWYVFEENLLRNVKLTYNEDVTIKGIDAWSYVIASDQFLNSTVNPDNARYYLNIEGFNNLTTVPRNGVTGLPIFLSKPHFLDCDPTYSNLVQSQTASGQVVNGLSPNRTIHDTVVNVAYYTGQTISGRKTIQVNLQLTPSQFGVYNNIPNGYFAPVFWVAESAELTDDQADQYQDIIKANRAALGIIIAFVVAGFIGLVVGIALIIIGKRRNDTQKDEKYPMTTKT